MPPTKSGHLIHRKVEFDGRPTSLRLEPEFWQYLTEIAFERKVAREKLISVVNQYKGKGVSLASALRVCAALSRHRVLII
jgi:predicted DNA-binding ribbon-helix-helix protein